MKLLSALAFGALVFSQVTSIPGNTGGGGGGTANISASTAGPATSLAIDISPLALSTLDNLLVQCWTGSTAPYTPLAITSINPATTSSITVNFSSSSNVVCRVNSSGATGPAGATGATGATGPSGLLSGALADIPATCTAGAQLYQATDQPITLQLYACTSTDNWTRVAYIQGTTAPGTCSVGQIFFDTDATAGSNLYLCAATNTWTQVTGGGGGGGGNPPYSASVSSQTSVTVSAATHGQGTEPVAFCFDNASPANAASCQYTVSGTGEVVFAWAPAFTGRILISSLDGGAGSSDWPANAQTGTTYTVLSGDKGKSVTFSNGSPVAVTLPQAGGSFPDGWYFLAKNIGGGAVTITPTTSTISGAASITLDTGEFAIITSDGTNYEASTNRTTVDSALSITRSRTGTQIGTGASVVTLSGTQTLENKTFVAPALGTPASGVATNLTGTAAGLTAGAATALAANPANCSAGSLPRGVQASGAAEGCAAVDLAAEVTGVLPAANGGRVNRQITLVATDVSSTGTKSCSVVEVAGTIVAAHLISNALPTGANLVVDVLKVAFTSYTGPASASSITASATPTIATGDANPRYEDTTLTGWTTSVAANDVVCVAISTAPSGGATWASLTMEVQ